MGKSLFNLAEHTIVERVLKPGNYLAKIVNMESKSVGRGKEFYVEFIAPEGRHREGFWYDHPSEDAKRIGRNQLKRIGICVGQPDLDLQEDPRTWEPLKHKPLGIAVRKEKNKDGSFVTWTKEGKTFDSYTIDWFAQTKEELPSYNPAVDEIEENEEDEEHLGPSADQIMNRVSKGNRPLGGAPDPEDIEEQKMIKIDDQMRKKNSYIWLSNTIWEASGVME